MIGKTQKHTPGPLQASGSMVLETEYIGSARGVIAHCLQIGAEYPESRFVACANAKLYAAAPELLHACEVTFDAVTLEEQIEAVELMRAAIAKAKGGTHEQCP